MEHWRLQIFVKKLLVLEAFKRSLVGPPLSLTGNKTWVGGFICLGAAFSGRPIRTPIEVEDLFLIKIWEEFEMIFVIEESLMFRGFLKSKLKKIFASLFSRIIDDFLICGTPNFSRIFFEENGYSIVSSLTLRGCKSSDNSWVEIWSQK